MNLTDLFNHYKSDKGTQKSFKDQDPPHRYSIVYEEWLKHLRDQPINLLEVGLFWRGEVRDGRKAVELGPRSLYAWRDFFIKGNIYGLDILDGTRFSEGRVKVLQGDATKRDVLENVVLPACNLFDVIVDDGSHLMEDATATFKLLYPYLNVGGFYFIEDIHNPKLLNMLRQFDVEPITFNTVHPENALILIRK